MWEVTQEAQISVAHSVLRHGEERLHGHNWRVVAVVHAHELDAHGLVLDVEELGRRLQAVLAPYDHTLLNQFTPFDTQPATAERFAQVVSDQLRPAVDDGRVRLTRIEVWEGYIRKASYLLAL